MEQLRFDATAITAAAAAGSLASLQLALGRLSDRWRRKVLLLLCFGTTPFGLLVLATAGELWQIWIAGVLQTVLGVSMVAASALALSGATIWIGILLGLSVGGAAINGLGMTPALLMSVVVSLAALGLLPVMELRGCEGRP